MFRNILSVGGFTLLSRLAGFIRDVVMAAVLGAGPVADAAASCACCCCSCCSRVVSGRSCGEWACSPCGS